MYLLCQLHELEQFHGMQSPFIQTETSTQQIDCGLTGTLAVFDSAGAIC